MYERARILFQLGRYTLAREELARTLAEDPGDTYAHALLALCLARQGVWDEALGAAEEAIRSGPDEPFSHYSRAYVLRGRGLPVPAAQSARESVRVQPDYVHGWLILGQIRLDQRDYREAARCAREGLASVPDNRGCLLVLAASLVEMGYDEEAGGVMASLLRVAPDYPHAHVLEGWRLLYRQENGAATARFQEALRLDPELENARNGLRQARTERNPLQRIYQRFHGPLMRRINRLNPDARWLPRLVIRSAGLGVLFVIGFVLAFMLSEV